MCDFFKYDKYLNCVYFLVLILLLTWANVATTKPNVNAIETTFEPGAMQLHTPIATKMNVPTNSASNIFHILRLSVRSDTPITCLTPEKKSEQKEIYCFIFLTHSFFKDKNISVD